MCACRQPGPMQVELHEYAHSPTACPPLLNHHHPPLSFAPWLTSTPHFPLLPSPTSPHLSGLGLGSPVARLCPRRQPIRSASAPLSLHPPGDPSLSTRRARPRPSRGFPLHLYLRLSPLRRTSTGCKTWLVRPSVKSRRPSQATRSGGQEIRMTITMMTMEDSCRWRGFVALRISLEAGGP